MEGYVCTAFDEVTNQCTEWAAVLYAIPTLTLEDSFSLSAAITLLWASAWCWSITRSVV